MTHSVISQWDSESLKRFLEMSDQEKQTVLALLQISPQSSSTEIQNSESKYNSILTPPNTNHSDPGNHLLVHDQSPSNEPLNSNFVATDHSEKIGHEDSSNTEVLHVSFNTINLDEQDRAKSREGSEVAISPCSPVVSCPLDISRLNSACSEEIAEAFQGQFLETLRTKNDGSARRPMNAYMLFCKINRTQVKEKNPGLSNREISQILGKMWHQLDKEEWQKYTNMAFELRKAHYVAYPDFKWSKKQKRPASFPSKRVQLQEGDISNIRPRSNLYPDVDFIDPNFIPYTYKPFSLDLKNELNHPRPHSHHFVNQPRLATVPTFCIDNPDNVSPASTCKNNFSANVDVLAIKKRKVAQNPAQIPLIKPEELLQHYLIPNLVTSVPRLYQAANVQALVGTSAQDIAERQLGNQLHLAFPMYHAGAAASLMGQGIQLIPTDVKSHYLSFQQGLLQATKFLSDS